MEFIGSFAKFAKRVLEAAKEGDLDEQDLQKLDNLLTRVGKRKAVLSKGILSALSANGASEEDIERFGELLEKAEKRIVNDKDPFTEKDQQEIEDIFSKADISKKTTRWFCSQVDELLAKEMKDHIDQSEKVSKGVPKKSKENKETTENQQFGAEEQESEVDIEKTEKKKKDKESEESTTVKG